MLQQRRSVLTLLWSIASLLILSSPVAAQTAVDDTTAGKSMGELIAAQKYIVLQVLSDDGDVAVHLFGAKMKSAAEEEFQRLEKEIRNEATRARLDFGATKEKKAADIWGVISEAATQVSPRRGDLRLVKVTRRGADFIGYETPGEDETWLPLRKIAVVRQHQDD